MKRYFKENREYFNWLNRYKELYFINRLHITRKHIVIEYEERNDPND